ncbi:MAG: hypothetical protein BGO31_07950 [Bacteroidetes bacterium 43-16]|nr:MAG: hypothetical protein BGO31_07950 [Bacteroidetes bacterium 43-16]
MKASKDGRILSPVRLKYMTNRRSLSDSIVPEEEGRRKSHTYYEGLLYSNAVMSMQDHDAGTTLYYGIGGKDSLSIAKVNGKSREITWYRDDGMDTLLKRWNEEGNLEYERKQDSEKIWSEEGKLLQHTFDSLVQQKWWVRCQKIWYPNGVLSSVTYHYGETPCLTWKYYNEQGKLTRQVKHKPLKGSPVGYGVGIIPEEPMIFHSVYQKEAVSELFNKDLNSRLALLMCHANVALEGIYRVQVDLSETGRLTLKQIEGLNAAEIREEIAAFFKETQPVKTAVRNGRPYAQVLQLILKVTPKEK